MIQFASQHSILAIALLVGLASVVPTAYARVRRRFVVPFSVGSSAPIVTDDPFTFWRNEIRNIVKKYGSPVKAAIQIERQVNAMDFDTLNDAQLQALYKYWREISHWCGRVRIELLKPGTKTEWSPKAWTQLFNVFGKVNLRIQIAWYGRSDPRVNRKPGGERQVARN